MFTSATLNSILLIVAMTSPLWCYYFAPRVALIAIFNVAYVSKVPRPALAGPQAVIAMFLIWIPLVAANASLDLLSPLETESYQQKFLTLEESQDSPQSFITFLTIWACLVLSPFAFLSARFAAVWTMQYRMPQWLESTAPHILAWCALSVGCLFTVFNTLPATDLQLLLAPALIVTSVSVFLGSPNAAPVGALASSLFYAWMLTALLAGPDPHSLEFASRYGLFFFTFLGLFVAQHAILRTTSLDSLEASLLSVVGPLRPR